MKLLAKQLEEFLAQGKINRREFLTGVSALGITASLAPGTWNVSALAGTPQKGGRFRIGTSDSSITDSLNPSLMNTDMVVNLSWQLRNNLVEVGPGGDLVPELAESWEPTADAATWIFKLRRGIEFHNGKTLDAHDVVYSINMHMGKESKSAAKGFVKLIKEIKADDPYTVVFTLNQGNVDFPAILTLPQLPIVMAGTTDFSIGTGGYILEDFNPSVRSFVKRNPNYWKEGRAHFDEVETIAIADVTARTNALMTGQIDAMVECDLKTVHLLEKAPNVQIANVPSRRHLNFVMRTDKPPFDNYDARMAMKYAIDREHIIKITMAGYGTVGNDHPISPTMPFYASELPQRPYDPEKARYHIKKAGLEDYTFKLHVSRAPWGQAEDAALLYQQHTVKAGIKIEVVKEPSDGYWKRVWRQMDFCASRWSGRPTEDMMLAQAYSGESSWNESYFNNERFNKLLKAARIELDQAKRRDMYVEMQEIIHNEGGTVVMAFTNMVDAVSKRIKFGKLSAQYPLDGRRCAERWWFV